MRSNSRRGIRRPLALGAAAAWGATACVAVLLTACGSAAPGQGTAGTGPAGTGPAGTGPAGTGPAGTGPAGTGPATPAAARSAGPITSPTSSPGTRPPSTGPASTVPASTPLGPAGQPCDPRVIAPIGVSFTSASDGHLLGITLSGCALSTASKIVLRRTADGGLHWTAVPAPPAPWGGVAPDGTGQIPADGVTSVLFADARDGWAYGPGLWATHDGGATWHQVATGGRAVQSMTATAGQVIASLEGCDPADLSCDDPESWLVETSPADRDAWRPVAGAGIGGTAAGAVLAAQGGTGYAAVPTGPYDTDVSMITGPADGSAPWVSRPLPCRPGAIALTAVTATRVLLACALLGAHPATTYLYASSDAGQHWQRFAVLGLYDGASTIGQAPYGTVLVAGIYDGVELSRDGGRTWTRPAMVDNSDFVQGGDSIQAELLTSTDGYVISRLGPLWITSDAGRTWTQVLVD